MHKRFTFMNLFGNRWTGKPSVGQRNKVVYPRFFGHNPVLDTNMTKRWDINSLVGPALMAVIAHGSSMIFALSASASCGQYHIFVIGRSTLYTWILVWSFVFFHKLNSCLMITTLCVSGLNERGLSQSSRK